MVFSRAVSDDVDVLADSASQVHEQGGLAPDWIAGLRGCWFVVHTRARNEKAVARSLAERSVAHFLPLMRTQHHWAKSSATYEVPLFPGYLFLCGNHDGCEVARRTNRVANILPVRDQDRLRRELSHIHRVLTHGAAVQHLMGIQVGCRYRVRSGPLKGLEGVVVQEGHRCRMYLAVALLGQSAVIDIDAALLERPT